MSSKLLHERVAFISGSTRGIGWQTAQLFAKEGAHVIINGHSSPEHLNSCVDQLTKMYGIKAMGISADFADPDQINACYQTIFKHFKKLDIVVNNPGIMHHAFLGMID